MLTENEDTLEMPLIYLRRVDAVKKVTAAVAKCSDQELEALLQTLVTPFEDRLYRVGGQP
jgi:hypothetical protein